TLASTRIRRRSLAPATPPMTPREPLDRAPDVRRREAELRPRGARQLENLAKYAARTPNGPPTPARDGLLSGSRAASRSSDPLMVLPPRLRPRLEVVHEHGDDAALGSLNAHGW